MVSHSESDKLAEVGTRITICFVKQIYLGAFGSFRFCIRGRPGS
jgi:hypothetical protein